MNGEENREIIRGAFEASVAAKMRFLDDHLEALERVIDVISERFLAGGKILLFGNGGSAADAQHIAAEFVNRYRLERPPLPALALTTDSSALTSIGNDVSFDDVFSRQVKALGSPGDVAFAISTSGNSANVLKAVEACRQKEIVTVGFAGGDGGALAGVADHLLCVSSTRVTARIQEAHILIGHVICEMVDQRLFGQSTES